MVENRDLEIRGIWMGFGKGGYPPCLREEDNKHTAKNSETESTEKNLYAVNG
jgi:hypothetical protein